MFARIKFHIFIVVLLLLSTANFLVFPVHSLSKDYVILLHGLGRTSRSMRPIERHLEEYGFCVININYPSRKLPIEELAKYIQAEIEKQCTDKEVNIHFVTHSMGGIILRFYLGKNHLENLGRVVMLSPPNKGSEIVDTLRKFFIFSMLIGPAGLQLGTNQDSIPNTLGPVNFDLGIITGKSSLNPIFSLIIPGDDDGRVSVERSKVSGMKDFMVVPHSHSFIMRSSQVADQVTYFLKSGRFYKKLKQEVTK